MPSLGDSSPASTPSAGWVVRVLQWLWYAVLVGITAFCVTLLAVRYIVFPHVEEYRDDLSSALAKQLGQPVEIDRLATGWDGWNPKLIVYGFRVRSGAADAASPPVLDLPEVNLIIAWTSLPALDLRLKELALEGPRLAIRRDKSGKLRVGGIAVDPDQMGGDTPVVDWLLRQPHIAVHDALITWKDDVRNTGELVLDHVQLRLESRFGRHRFGLLGTPPTDIGSTIDVRGDLRVESTTSWEEATGKVYARVDYADIAAWSQWLPMPTIRTGKGALRFWLDVDGGKPRDLTADVELLDVKARIEPELPELDLASLNGRAGWSGAPPRRELTARNLVFVTTSGQRFDAEQLSLAIHEAKGNGAATSLLEFDRLQLAPLRELAAHLPLPEKLRTDLAELAPRGTLTHGRVLWEGEMDAPSVYNAAADFTDVGIAPHGDVPGVQGLSGRIEMTQAGGDLKMSGRSVTVDA